MPKKRRAEGTNDAQQQEEEQVVIQNKKAKIMTVNWGDNLCSWKEAHMVDEEQERIDRQKAAFGGETVARIKDLHVLVVGCRGVGVETCKNLILSNVGSVTIWDPRPTVMADLGTNFYLTTADAANQTPRAQACLTELKSLNPFCKVELSTAPELTDEYLESSHYTAVVVTELLPETARLNETCRARGMAFCLACNHGVTASLFSDFGLHHEITDPNGEPTQMLAVSNVEVLMEKTHLLKVAGQTDGQPVVVVTVAQNDHGLDDGDMVIMDDMRGPLEPLNGARFEVKRVAFVSPTAAKISARDVIFKEILKQTTSSVVKNFEKQYDYYKQLHDESDEAGKKFPVRTITMFNRLALVMTNDQLPEGVTKESLASLYESGGLLQQVRPVVEKDYKSFSETLVKTPVPQMLRGEDWEAGKGIDVHISMAAVLEFHQQEKRWPAIHNADDASKVWELAQKISADRQATEGSCWAQKISFGFPTGEPDELDEVRIKRFARLFQTELTGLCAFLGGAAAAEVLKKVGKYTPIDQWFHHDEHVLVTDECESNIMPLFGSRYDHQLAIMGKDFQARAANQRVFLVGCGALGCEYLKGLSLMGVATGKDGKIYVTDMDRIEVSNLSRQFLFRDSDVGSPKSVSGARVVKGWNPQMNIEALEKKVGADTEDFFNDDFWESLDVCWNALDNVLARKYTDSRCLLYAKPLLESGTLGTKCNHEVILPYRTSTYNDGTESDENENQIAMCTLRSYPYLPLHCIEYAKQAFFSDYFEFGPDQYETFRKDPATFFEQLDAMGAGEQAKSLEMIQFYIDLQKSNGGKITFEACVKAAFDRMIEDFRTSILNLCHSADEMEKSSGEKFWTGTKRRPRPVDWTTPMPELMEYLYCTSNMYAVIWGATTVRNREAFEKVVNDIGLEQPGWSPPSKNVDLSEADDEGAGGSEADVEKLKADLYAVDTSTLQPAQAHDFEKDDDSNFHVDFLTVATNLRAWNYDIKSSPRHTVKVTAGKIIPALATTTAMVCGLVDIEFCKLVMGLQNMGRDKFLNSNINLAAGSGNFTTFSPDPPIVLKSGLEYPRPESFTSWDKINLAFIGKDELSVEQLVKYLEGTFDIVVDRVFEHENTDDKALYRAVDRQKLLWDITFDTDGKPKVSEGVFTRWPNIKMAVQMLGRLPPSSGQRKVFENQVNTVKRSLDKTKEEFTALFQGPVSAAYRSAYRPEDEEKQQYFDAVFLKRDYILLGVDCHMVDKGDADIHLPCIKYVFSAGGDRANKRSRLES